MGRRKGGAEQTRYTVSSWELMVDEQREGLIGKKEARGGNTARDNPGQRGDMENKAMNGYGD